MLKSSKLLLPDSHLSTRDLDLLFETSVWSLSKRIHELQPIAWLVEPH